MIKQREEMRKDTYKNIEKNFKNVFRDIEDSMEFASSHGDFEIEINAKFLKQRDLENIKRVLVHKGYTVSIYGSEIEITWW